MKQLIKAATVAVILSIASKASAQGVEWFATEVNGEWGIMTLFVDVSNNARPQVGTATIRCLSNGSDVVPVISLFEGSGNDGVYQLLDSNATPFQASTDMLFVPANDSRNLGGETTVFISGSQIYGPELSAVLRNMGTISATVKNIADEDNSQPDSVIYESFKIRLNLESDANNRQIRILFSSLDVPAALSRISCA